MEIDVAGAEDAESVCSSASEVAAIRHLSPRKVGVEMVGGPETAVGGRPDCMLVPGMVFRLLQRIHHAVDVEFLHVITFVA